MGMIEDSEIAKPTKTEIVIKKEAKINPKYICKNKFRTYERTQKEKP
jgi:hypothetical protein